MSNQWLLLLLLQRVVGPPLGEKAAGFGFFFSLLTALRQGVSSLFSDSASVGRRRKRVTPMRDREGEEKEAGFFSRRIPLRGFL